jgi:hypothetical protein
LKTLLPRFQIANIVHITRIRVRGYHAISVDCWREMSQLEHLKLLDVGPVCNGGLATAIKRARTKLGWNVASAKKMPFWVRESLVTDGWSRRHVLLCRLSSSTTELAGTVFASGCVSDAKSSSAASSCDATWQRRQSPQTVVLCACRTTVLRNKWGTEMVKRGRW